MTEAEARALLEIKVAHTTDPTLSVGEVDQLVDLAGTEVDGWNLDYAAAEGWRWKAGKAVPAYTFAIDGQQSNQSDIFEHCMRQAEFFQEQADAAGGGVGGAAAEGIWSLFQVSTVKASSENGDSPV